VDAIVINLVDDRPANRQQPVPGAVDADDGGDDVKVAEPPLVAANAKAPVSSEPKLAAPVVVPAVASVESAAAAPTVMDPDMVARLREAGLADCIYDGDMKNGMRHGYGMRSCTALVMQRLC